jgi:mannosyl-oligosaccharide alpha-1,2-mannosidase
MTRITAVVVLTTLLSGTFALPQNVPQDLKSHVKRDDLPPAEERAQAVIDTFRTAW